MPENVSSLSILWAGILLAIALWMLSVLVVRWDAHRRGLGESERKVWLVLSFLLPLFGAALYLALRVLWGRLSPPASERLDMEDARMTEVKSPAQPGSAHPPVWNWPPDVPEPAWGQVPPRRSNGKQSQNTPSTLVAVGQRPLRVGYDLVALRGPHQGQQFVLDQLPVRIGRSPDVTIPLDADLNVSRNHAEIYEWNGRLRIRDLQSSHGTFINDHVVADQVISPGDRIVVGKTVLLVREL